MRYRKFALLLALIAAAAQVAAAGPLQVVRIVEVGPTIVSNPAKVKSPAGPSLVQDSLREALRDAGFATGESPIKAHIVLDEFTSGSFAKRFVIGFGAGRSAVTAHLVISDGSGKDIANIRIHVRGNMSWNSYEGGKTQRRQAVNSFEKKLREEIEKLK